jgi:hypothetical protein
VAIGYSIATEIPASEIFLKSASHCRSEPSGSLFLRLVTLMDDIRHIVRVWQLAGYASRNSTPDGFSTSQHSHEKRDWLRTEKKFHCLAHSLVADAQAAHFLRAHDNASSARSTV